MILQTPLRRLAALFQLILPAGLFMFQGSCNTNTGPRDALSAETARVAFQSQCAQNVFICTRSFPTAVITLDAIHGQTVTATDAGFLVEQPGYGESIWIQFRGSGSVLGLNATTLTHRWTFGATNDDPCTMTPGTEFSTQADPLVPLDPGLHYIRLTVTNDNILGRLESPQCGVIAENVPAFHFVEVELDVRH